MTYGKHASFDEFLNAYRSRSRDDFSKAIGGLPHDRKLDALRSPREEAEVQAHITHRFLDEEARAEHFRFNIKIDRVVSATADIQEDVEADKTQGREVLVAARFGDSMGLPAEVGPLLTVGAAVHLKGVYIPADKAYSNGGQKEAVLHFVHHPNGFTCVGDKCFK